MPKSNRPNKSQRRFSQASQSQSQHSRKNSFSIKSPSVMKKSGSFSSIDNLLNCKKCEDYIVADDKSIECYNCREWYHFSCSDLTEKNFNFLSHTGEEMQWVCPLCTQGIVSRKKREDNNEEKFDLLKS